MAVVSACDAGPKAWNIEQDQAGLWYQAKSDRLLYLEKSQNNGFTEYRMVIAAASPREYPSSQLWLKPDEGSKAGSYTCVDDPRLTVTITGTLLTLRAVNSDGSFSETWTGVGPGYRQRQLEHYGKAYQRASAKAANTLEDVYQRTRLFVLINFLKQAKLPQS